MAARLLFHCTFKTDMRIIYLETFYPFSDAGSDDALQDDKNIGLSCVTGKVINEVVNVKIFLISDHEEHILLFKLQTSFTGLTVKAVSLTIFFMYDH